MKIAVTGIGKLGLPLAAQFASKGHKVVGVEVNANSVNTINAGQIPFSGEAHLDEYIARLVIVGNLRPTTDCVDGIPGADAIVIVVPLFVDNDGRPDFEWMDSATRGLATNLAPGTLVRCEASFPVATTRTHWKPMIEEISGPTEGDDFRLVFSPERVLTGRVFEDLRRYPKVVGGLRDKRADLARSFNEPVLDFDERPDLNRPNSAWDLWSTAASEMAKPAETTFPDVNIGLANQISILAAQSGIDIYQMIDACSSQPFSHIHRPGIAIGGHCLPVYPCLYLSHAPESTVVSAARQANAVMPELAVERFATLSESLEGNLLAALGAVYRGGVKETAFSSVFDTVRHLEAAGARVSVHDPMYTDGEVSLDSPHPAWGTPWTRS